jgi:hypothetical protein
MTIDECLTKPKKPHPKNPSVKSMVPPKENIMFVYSVTFVTDGGLSGGFLFMEDVKEGILLVASHLPRHTF